MIIETTSAKFQIELVKSEDGFVKIFSNSPTELQRFFGSVKITPHSNPELPYKVSVHKEEISNALIVMVKELDYSNTAMKPA